jgi:hypothetical protein
LSIALLRARADELYHTIVSTGGPEPPTRPSPPTLVASTTPPRLAQPGRIDTVGRDDQVAAMRLAWWLRARGYGEEADRVA